MITYMTRATFGTSHEDLDNARLHAVMEQSMSIFDDLTGVKELGDQRHPILGMWRGYEFALGIYAMMGNLEWTFHRGYADHKYMKFFYAAIKDMQSDDPGFTFDLPPWWGDIAVLLSHRSALMRMDKSTYNGKWKNCPENWPFIWPQIDDSTQGYALWLSRVDKKLIREGKRTPPDKATLERIVNWP